jgi:hypothetical protein
MKIYELNNEIEQTLSKYFNAFDEDWVQIIEDENLKIIQNELFELQNQKWEFIEWVLKKRANLLSDVSWLDLEIKRLSEMKNNINKKIERSDKFINAIIKPIYQWKTLMYSNWQVWYKKSSWVIIQDEMLIPEEYKTKEIKEIIKIPLKWIWDAIKNGIDVPWAYIEERQNLFIK